jgi:hypothetical protein
MSVILSGGRPLGDFGFDWACVSNGKDDKAPAVAAPVISFLSVALRFM